MTDIDRLHRTSLIGTYDGSYSGFTYGQCDTLAITLCLGYNKVICLTSRYNDINYILSMLNGILDEYDITIIEYNKISNIITTSVGDVVIIPTSYISNSLVDIENSGLLRGYSRDIPIIIMGHND